MRSYILILSVVWSGCTFSEKNTPVTQTHNEIYIVTTTNQQSKYLESRVLPNIIMLPNDVPKSIIVAQALLESGNGTSSVVHKHNNHFGHKTSKGYITYKSDSLAFVNHYRLLKTKYNPNSNDWMVWCDRLGRSNYSESKDYGKLLKKLITNYKLYELDRI